MSRIIQEVIERDSANRNRTLKNEYIKCGGKTAREREGERKNENRNTLEIYISALYR